MYGVKLYAADRLAVVDEGLSHHEAGRRFGIDRRREKKMRCYPPLPTRSNLGSFCPSSETTPEPRIQRNRHHSTLS